MPRPRAPLPAKPQSSWTLSRCRTWAAIWRSAACCASGRTRSSQPARGSMRCARSSSVAGADRAAGRPQRCGPLAGGRVGASCAAIGCDACGRSSWNWLATRVERAVAARVAAAPSASSPQRAVLLDRVGLVDGDVQRWAARSGSGCRGADEHQAAQPLDEAARLRPMAIRAALDQAARCCQQRASRSHSVARASDLGVAVGGRSAPQAVQPQPERRGDVGGDIVLAPGAIVADQPARAAQRAARSPAPWQTCVVGDSRWRRRHRAGGGTGRSSGAGARRDSSRRRGSAARARRSAAAPSRRPAASSTSSSRQRRSGATGASALQCGASQRRQRQPEGRPRPLRLARGAARTARRAAHPSPRRRTAAAGRARRR